MQMTRQFIYSFIVFVVSFFLDLWWSHRAAGKSPNILVVSPPPLGPCTDMPSCSSCQLLLRCWKWKCLPLGLVSARVPWRPVSLGCSSARRWDGGVSPLLPLIPGEQTGTPVSETHQVCGWCPSCSTDVWSGSACRSSSQADSFGVPTVWQHEPSLRF